MIRLQGSRPTVGVVHEDKEVHDSVRAMLTREAGDERAKKRQGDCQALPIRSSPSGHRMCGVQKSSPSHYSAISFFPNLCSSANIPNPMPKRIREAGSGVGESAMKSCRLFP